MANYINKDILCQAYVHIETPDMDKKSLATFNKTISNFIESRGKFFIYEEVDTEVNLKDGSLKVYATIIGSIYLGITQYGSFRSGVDYMASDIKRLSDIIVSECLFQTKSRHDNVIRVEARIGVIGQLKSIIDEIRLIESQLDSRSVEQIGKRLSTLSENIAKMEANLHDPKDVPYIRENLCQMILEMIPQEPKKNPKSPPTKESTQIYIDSRRKLLEQLQPTF